MQQQPTTTTPAYYPPPLSPTEREPFARLVSPESIPKNLVSNKRHCRRRRVTFSADTIAKACPALPPFVLGSTSSAPVIANEKEEKNQKRIHKTGASVVARGLFLA